MYQFITKIRLRFICGERKLVKHKKSTKCYDHGCSRGERESISYDKNLISCQLLLKNIKNIYVVEYRTLQKY